MANTRRNTEQSLAKNVFEHNNGTQHYLQFLSIKKPLKAQFRRQTFHEPNLIHWIIYMNILASESIGNACFNLERLSRSFRLTRPGISSLEPLWNGFDSDAELFLYRT